MTRIRATHVQRAARATGWRCNSCGKTLASDFEVRKITRPIDATRSPRGYTWRIIFHGFNDHWFPHESPTLHGLFLSLRDWILDRNPALWSDDTRAVVQLMDELKAKAR